jgi:GNAT superfamily N-acetyltransferase
MSRISIINRPMSPEEMAQMNHGFNQYAVENHNPVEVPERHGFVATDGTEFIGCASGLAYKSSGSYGSYFYLSDLFVEKSYRRSGLGSQLLKNIEEEVKSLGITHIWTWTAGYEAPGFYLKQGYSIFTEMEHWYQSGHSRIGLRKKLS